MALSRYFGNMWSDPWEAFDVPSLLGDQYFGQVVPEDFFRGRMRPAFQGESGVSKVINTKDEFRINMDVKHFKPEEIKISSKDNKIVVNARHEERPDEHGFIMREFTRSYVLPKDVDPKTVTSSLNNSGVLTIKAPKLALEGPKEQMIPITMDTGDSK